MYYKGRLNAKKKKNCKCAGYFYACIGMKVRRFKRSLIYWGISCCISKYISLLIQN